MRRCWWTVWIEVAIVTVILVFAYQFVENKIEELVSPYLIEEDEVGERNESIITDLVEKLEDKLGIRLDYENMIFDYANEYAKTMMEQSEEERTVIEETTEETDTK